MMTSVFGYCKADPNIPINELDYGYIEKCKDINKLQKILEILRSGEEGIYPALEQFTEKQLAKNKPDSPLLDKCRKEKSINDIPKSEIEKTVEDLNLFSSSVNTKDTSLSNDDDESLPPIRNTKLTTNAVKGSKRRVGDNINKKSSVPKGADYWEELTKEVDATGEGEEFENVCKEKSSTSNINLKTSKQVHELLSEQPIISKNEDLGFKAESEKNKGNEAFRCGDYQEALVYYNRSIDIHSNPAALNNRAITLIKLEKFKEALIDCEKVIKLEPLNIKAFMRRGIANKSLGLKEQAHRAFEKVVELEPTNKRGIELLAEVKKELENKSQTVKKKGTRMKIEEVNTNLESNSAKLSSLQNGEKGKESNLNNSSCVISDDGSCSLANVMELVNSPKKVDNVNNTYTSSEASTSLVNQVLSGNKEQSSRNSEVTASVTDLPTEVISAKNQGNSFYKAGQYAKASEMYSSCIDHLSINGNLYNSALATFYSNRSSCFSKMGESKLCIQDCEKSIEFVTSAKVFYKRACAYESIEKYIDAYQDYEHAFRIDSSSANMQALSRLGNVLRVQYGQNWRDKLHKNTVKSFVDNDGVQLRPNENNMNNQIKEELVLSNNEIKINAENEVTKQLGKKTANDIVQTNPNQTYVPSKDIENFKKTDVQKPDSCVESENQTKLDTETTQQVPCENERKDKSILDEKPSVRCTEQKLAKEKKILDFFEMKERGNKLVQKEKYEEAAKCYSQCAELLPKEIPSYTNRALCHLKMKQPEKAIEDCTHALKLQPSCVKALFRRATARKMTKDYKGALADFAKVLKIEPNNNVAKNQMEACKADFHAELRNIQAQNEANKKKDSSIKSKKVTIEEVDSTDFPIRSKMSTKVGKCPLAKGSSPRNPSLKKMTGFEFLHAWNNVKSEKTSDYADLLHQIEPTKLPDLLSNKLDGEILKNFIRTINEHFTHKDTFRQGIQLLKSLCKVPRFVTMLMFLNTTEKTLLRTAIDQLENRVKQSHDKSLLPDVNSLRSSYRCP